MNISGLLDLVVIALLAATIVYCFRLNKRLDSLRASQGEMARLTAEFTRSTDRARGAIADLKAAQGEAAEALAETVAKAQGLHDELAIITQSADALAARLERAISDRRGEPRAEAPRAAPSSPSAPAASAPAAPASEAITEEGLRSAAERELLQALRRAK